LSKRICLRFIHSFERSGCSCRLLNNYT
jgi:hypothetical protein